MLRERKEESRREQTRSVLEQPTTALASRMAIAERHSQSC